MSRLVAGFRSDPETGEEGKFYRVASWKQQSDDGKVRGCPEGADPDFAVLMVGRRKKVVEVAQLFFCPEKEFLGRIYP